METSTRSVKGTRWKLAQRAPDDFLSAFPEFPKPVAQLLYNRGLKTDAAVNAFLNPVYTQHQHAPALLGGIEAAVATILDALATGERILIHGDYDADGVTSTAVLVDVLTRLGADVIYFVPDRYRDGYGVSVDTLGRAAERGAKLVITVDCGISSAEAIASAREAGLKVIVTDHHIPPPEIPVAEAVINPTLPGETYPNPYLTGVGVAFKLAQALLASSDLEPLEREAAEKWLLDLVAIGTVADIGTLQGENRTLVKYGLLVLQKTRRPGLQALLKVAGADSVDTRRIGFTIAPRLNAAGRLKHADAALQLLLSTDPAEAQAMAEQLDSLNVDRREETEFAYGAAKESLGAVTDQRRALVAVGEWRSGIVGLVAGRLVGEFCRPALVIERGPEVSHGSARSIGGFHVTKALGEHAKYLERFGGHAAAAGFSIKTSNIDAFRRAFERYAYEHLSLDQLTPTEEVEAELTLADLNIELVDQLDAFAPSGPGNPEPLFQLRGVTVSDSRTVGETAGHLKLQLQTPDGRTIGAIGFGLGYAVDDLRQWRTVDLLGRPVANTFRSATTVEWHVTDFRRG